MDPMTTTAHTTPTSSGRRRRRLAPVPTRPVHEATTLQHPRLPPGAPEHDTLGIPEHWDDSTLILIHEYSELTGIPLDELHLQRISGTGPPWTRFQHTGPLYITVAQARHHTTNHKTGTQGEQS